LRGWGGRHADERLSQPGGDHKVWLFGQHDTEASVQTDPRLLPSWSSSALASLSVGRVEAVGEDLSRADLASAARRHRRGPFAICAGPVAACNSRVFAFVFYVSAIALTKLRSCNPEREGLLHADGQWAPFQQPSRDEETARIFQTCS
jgi:hypothetical protein